MTNADLTELQHASWTVTCYKSPPELLSGGKRVREEAIVFMPMHGNWHCPRTSALLKSW